MKNFADDSHLDVCHNIEATLVQCYRRDPKLTDLLCEFALDNAKIAIKQHFGFAQNERVSQSDSVAPIVAFCVCIGLERIGKINELTLKEFVVRLDKINATVHRIRAPVAVGTSSLCRRLCRTLTSCCRLRRPRSSESKPDPLVTTLDVNAYFVWAIRLFTIKLIFAKI